MKAREALETAEQFIDDGDPQSAFRYLKALYQKVPENLHVLQLLGQAYIALERPQAALNVFAKAVELAPTRVEFVLQKARLLAEQHQWRQAMAVFDEAIESTPESQGELLSERVRLCGDDRFVNEQDSECWTTLEDYSSALVAVERLEQVVADCERLEGLVVEEGEVHAYINQKAMALKKLHRYSEAESEWQRLLELLPVEQVDFRQHVQQSMDDCQGHGRDERERVASIVRKMLHEGVDESERATQQYHIAAGAIEAALDSVEAGESISEAFDTFMPEEDDEMVALSIARDIYNQANEPAPAFERADAAGFARHEVKHCDKIERVLSAQGFRNLGDYDPTHLLPILRKSVLLRVFVSDDGSTSAAAYSYRALWPGFMGWLIMFVKGVWRTHRVLELETELSNGRIVITNNTGKLNPFDQPPTILLNALPARTNFNKLVDEHINTVERLIEESESPLEVIPQQNFDDVVALQDRIRSLKNEWRQSSGVISDTELQALLGERYGEFASKVRYYLEEMA